MNKKTKIEFEKWNKIKNKYEAASSKAKQQYDLYNTIYTNISFGNDTLKKILNVDKLNPMLIEGVKSDDPKVQMGKTSVGLIFQKAGPDADVAGRLRAAPGDAV